MSMAQGGIMMVPLAFLLVGVECQILVGYTNAKD